MEKYKKRELRNRYKDKVIIGGVYCIKCNENNHIWIKSVRDMSGSKNRFEFAVSTNSCPEPDLRIEWAEYGAKSFSFVILEEIKKKENQSEREFLNDINVLLEMWLEKSRQDNL